MGSPAGPCEWCGGPQVWTFIRGDMYVACESGCLPLSLEGLTPPPVSEGDMGWPEWEPAPPPEPEEELEGGEGVEPPEGGDAEDKNASGRPLIHIGVPLEAVLLNLWEGGPDASTS